MQKINKRISFLFGSGISLPAGLPLASGLNVCIRKHLTDLNDLSSRTFNSRNSSNSICLKYRPTILLTIYKFIEKYIDKYYHDIYNDDVYQTNYEELYDVLFQIKDSIEKQNYNPLTYGLLSSVKKEINLNEIIFENSSNLFDYDLLVHFITILMDEIKNKLISMLSNFNDISYLNSLIDVCEASKLNVNFFTLNHDIILETLFDQNKISYTDGFYKKSINGIRLWHPKLFSYNTNKILKLHGSLNWHIIMDSSYKMTLGHGLLHSTNENNQKIEISINNQSAFLIRNTPIFLTGTNIKSNRYHYGIYNDLFYHFYRLLENTQYLFVSGYSFGDLSVNSRLISWLIRDRANRQLIIASKSLDSIISKAKGPIKSLIKNHYGKRIQIKLIPKYINKMNINDIFNHIK